MDTTSSASKRTRSPFPLCLVSSEQLSSDQADKTCKLARSFASITASPTPRNATPHGPSASASASAFPLPSQPTSLIIIRSFSLVIGNTHSRSYPVTRGIPQGSPLSPILFNILLSDFPYSPCTHALIYADDISLLCSAPTIQEAQDHLQRGLDAVHSWTTRWGLTWVPSHIGVRGNIVADRAAAEAHSHPSPINLTTDQTDSLTNLKTTCNRHWDTELTDALQYTSLGRIRHDTRHHLWTHSPSRALDTAVTRLRIGHTRLNSHLHKLGMTEDPHCPWCPTQLDTPEHLLHCPRHHSHRMALLQSLSPLLLRRPTLAELLGGSPDPGLAFKVLKHTRTFLQKSGQLHRI
ncbi:RNA-directed DNA polymerase from mobile element jockey [Chionoecetes opilio]|uniref:RNA-directed DNA polymerase from mobile element jockey n=1 Tax=Chionoecetes opilio TaxID=41210 RepID=A0A8J4Y8M4_CHIOP|nr:RNA-directed DNA polymerase from mobile element jockey [Chionoecetes opilio]